MPLFCLLTMQHQAAHIRKLDATVKRQASRTGTQTLGEASAASCDAACTSCLVVAPVAACYHHSHYGGGGGHLCVMEVVLECGGAAGVDGGEVAEWGVALAVELGDGHVVGWGVRGVACASEVLGRALELTLVV